MTQANREALYVMFSNPKYKVYFLIACETTDLRINENYMYILCDINVGLFLMKARCEKKIKHAYRKSSFHMIKG